MPASPPAGDGTPAVTPNWGFSRYASVDAADFVTDWNAFVDLLDSEAVKTSDSRLSDQRTPLDASVTVPKLAADVIAMFGGNVEFWIPHIVNYDDQTTPPAGADIVGRVPIQLAPGATRHLVGVKHICTTLGSTPTVFRVQTDHGSHGTFSNASDGTTTLSGIQPTVNGGVYNKVYLGTPIALADDDTVLVRLSTAGNSKGVNIAPILAYGKSL